MKNLVSLRHLYISQSKHFPGQDISCLTSLHTLPIFVVGTKGRCEIGELGCFTRLGGELAIFGLQNVRNNEEARKAKLWEKKGILKLEFSWPPRGHYDNDEEVLKGLEPHSNLKSLTIWFYGGEQFPSWLVRKSGVSGPSACFQLINLVELKLSRCPNVQNLPTLGLYPNLKILKIEFLVSVSSIGKEFYVDDNWCYNSDKLFPLLEVFSLKNMSNLEEWLIEEQPAIPVFPSLKKLSIFGCGKLSRVPIMSRFSSLERLQIKWCDELCWTKKLEDELGWTRELEELMEGDGVFPSTLKILRIHKCGKLSFIPGIKGGISSLRELEVKNCEDLIRIGETLLASMCLTEVSIKDCPNLICISLNGGSPSLVSLILDDCKTLLEIEGSLSKSSRLETLRLVNCKGLKSLPSGLQTCTSLQDLSIVGCSNINVESFPAGESLGFLTCLKTLSLGPFSNELEEFPLLTSIHNPLSSLEYLRLHGWEKLSSLPHQLQHLTVLKRLEIWYFHGVKALPEWLGNLSSLQRLYIRDCKNLEQVPSTEGMQRLSNLKAIKVSNCPGLKRKRNKLKTFRMCYGLLI